MLSHVRATCAPMRWLLQVAKVARVCLGFDPNAKFEFRAHTLVRAAFAARNICVLAIETLSLSGLLGQISRSFSLSS